MYAMCHLNSVYNIELIQHLDGNGWVTAISCRYSKTAIKRIAASVFVFISDSDTSESDTSLRFDSINRQTSASILRLLLIQWFVENWRIPFFCFVCSAIIRWNVQKKPNDCIAQALNHTWLNSEPDSEEMSLDAPVLRHWMCVQAATQSTLFRHINKYTVFLHMLALRVNVVHCFVLFCHIFVFQNQHFKTH